jgi:hypothetical protein
MQRGTPNHDHGRAFLRVFARRVGVMDVNRPCSGVLEEKGWADDSPALGEQPLLMENQCEALKSRELRLLLLEIPQEEEDPIALSLGVKNSGAVLRFKIPFSF